MARDRKQSFSPLALRSVQVSSYELVLDRRLGNLYSVPPGYLIVAAGNNTTDRAVAVTMSSALANRFMHVELKEDVESWWAISIIRLRNPPWPLTFTMTPRSPVFSSESFIP